MSAAGLRIYFTASAKPTAQQALERLVRRYGQSPVESADIVVPLGGDGWMLETLRERYADRLPVYGMHRGTVGFLMNDYLEDDLPRRLDAAVRAIKWDVVEWTGDGYRVICNYTEIFPWVFYLRL